MSKVVAALLFAVAMTALPAGAADSKADVTDMEALRAAVRSDKKAFVASVMALSEAEAKRFWPLYDAYQRGLDLSNRQRTRAIETLLGRDRGLSDPLAKDLARELLASDDAELKARRTLQPKLMRALPPTKAARYLQLEAKIRAVQDYDIAVTFPLVK